MNKKSLLALCVAGLVLSVLVFNGPVRSQKHSPQDGPLAAAPGNEIPDQVSYLFLFRHLAHLKKLAGEQQQKGKDGSGFQRRFQHVLDVDDEQFKAVNDIAISTIKEIDKLDQQAKLIVDEFKERYPDGVLPEGGRHLRRQRSWPFYSSNVTKPYSAPAVASRRCWVMESSRALTKP